MKMYLEILLLVVVVVVLVCLFFYPAPKMLSPTVESNPSSSVCFGEKCFQVELAETNAERETGLMNRTEMDNNRGMLFIFDKEGIYPFWMKNTLIPLDMVWIGADKKAVYVARNVQPCKSFICPLAVPSAKAKYVLEINAGLCEKMGLKLGDSLTLNIK